MILLVLYYIFIITFTVIYLIPFTLLWLLALPFDKHRSLTHHTSRLWAMIIYKTNPKWKLIVEGLEKIDKKKAYVIVSNHQSMMDIPLLYALPLNFKWISKKEVYKWPVFGMVLWMHDDIAIERGDSSAAGKMMQKSKKYLQEGVSVAIFPEGTRTKTGRVGRFKDGAVMIAKKSGVGMLPVAIDGTRDLFEKGRHKIHVKVLDHVSAEDVARTAIKDMTVQLNHTITAAHKQIREDLYKE